MRHEPDGVLDLGLTGPMTATIASPELLDFINWTLLPKLGRIRTARSPGGEILVPPTESGRDTDIAARVSSGSGQGMSRWGGFQALQRCWALTFGPMSTCSGTVT
jgi:hypothetical protein